jgi:organic hydroperoxide reductase OsmC/OhrA
MIESADYLVEIQASSPKTGKLDSFTDDLPTIEVASPPEFGGPESVWSPEHLFVAAISACLMTTFHAIAATSGIGVVDYRDRAIGHLRRAEDRLYHMERVTLRPTVVVDEDTRIDKTLRVLQKAERACLISRSVNSEIVMAPTVTGGHQEGT